MKKVLTGFIAIAIALTLCACSGGRVKDWQEQYDLGVRYLSEGNYEEAIIAFTAAIEIDPKQAPAYVGRGDAYALSGDTEENLVMAIQDYQVAIALDEANVDAYLGMANAYVSQGDIEKAMEVLKTGIEKSGGNSKLIARLAEIENIDGQKGKITLSMEVPDLKDSYPVNSPNSEIDACEYEWMVQFTDGKRKYEVGTSHFKHNGSAERSITLYEMQSDVWVEKENGSWSVIADAELKIDGTMLSWSFIIPDEYEFAVDDLIVTGQLIEINV